MAAHSNVCTDIHNIFKNDPKMVINIIGTSAEYFTKYTDHFPYSFCIFHMKF